MGSCVRSGAHTAGRSACPLDVVTTEKLARVRNGPRRRVFDMSSLVAKRRSVLRRHRGVILIESPTCGEVAFSRSIRPCKIGQESDITQVHKEEGRCSFANPDTRG